jgi:hypothetical protein
MIAWAILGGIGGHVNMDFVEATLAQLVERLIRNQQVAGSIPAGGSIFSASYPPCSAFSLFKTRSNQFARSADQF